MKRYAFPILILFSFVFTVTPAFASQVTKRPLISLTASWGHIYPPVVASPGVPIQPVTGVLYNGGSLALNISIQPVEVIPGNNGLPTIRSNTLNPWFHNVEITPASLTLQPGTEQSISITATTNMPPGVYLLGVEFDPHILPSVLQQYENQAKSAGKTAIIPLSTPSSGLLAVQVPGPVSHNLKLSFTNLSTISFSSSINTALKVRDTGDSAFFYDNEIDINGGANPHQFPKTKQSLLTPSLIFGHTFRSLNASWSGGFLGLNKYTVTGIVSYDNANLTLKKISLRKTVYTIPIWWVVIFAIIIILLILMIVQLIRKIMA